VLILDLGAYANASQFTGIGRRDMFAAFLIAGGGLFMVKFIAHTTVANAVVTTSLAPSCSAVVGRVFLNEVVSRQAWVAIAIALLSWYR